MHKKAQGISLNVIIIAAIALLVLVILSIIFIGRMGRTREEVDKCETNGGICKEECTGEYEREVTAYKCYYAEGDDIPSDKNVGDVNEDVKCCLRV